MLNGFILNILKCKRKLLENVARLILILFEVRTEQPWRFTTSKSGQYLAKQLTALSVSNTQPLAINDFNFGHPRDNASTPEKKVMCNLHFRYRLPNTMMPESERFIIPPSILIYLQQMFSEFEH